MKLEKIAITNVRGFWEGFEAELDPAVTAILGRNNAGKTGLLNTISNPGEISRYRGPASLPFAGATNDRQSIVQYRFVVDKQDIEQLTRHEFWLVFPGANLTSSQIQAQYAAFRTRDRITYEGQVVIETHGQIGWAALGEYAQVADPANGVSRVRFRANPASQGGVDVLENTSSGYPAGPAFLHPELGSVALQQLVGRRMFRFLAERKPALVMQVQPSATLAPDASNLVNVLDALQAEKARFRYYEECVKRLIPEIGEIRLKTVSPGQKSIRICFAESVSRTDLIFGLDELGTGTTQALSLVYAITMSEHPQIILLDEPSTYLHPGAARELLRLAARHKEHQYVIASHSPLVLEEFPTAGLILLDRSPEGFTTARKADVASIDDQKSVLRELGLSAADVFGADYVAWVEGPTERDVYSEIARTVGWSPRGLVIFPLSSTGDLSARQRDVAIELYRRLTNGIGLSPARMCFLLDKEDRSASDEAELQRLTGNRVYFAPAGRMLENSFLSPALVAQFLMQNRKYWNEALTLSATDVESIWDGLLDVKRFHVDFVRATDVERWKREVNAGRVLHATVDHVSEGKLEYRKTTHGLELLRLASEMKLDDVVEPLKLALKTALGGYNR
jgi:AAA domain, putative AbiEii toxin, Type IV TA system